MEYKKLALVPADFLQSHTSASANSAIENPNVKNVSLLDREIQDVLKQDLPEDKKAILYEQLVHRFNAYYRKAIAPREIEVKDVSKPTASSTFSPNSSDSVTSTISSNIGVSDQLKSEIFKSIAPQQKKKAELVLEYIHRNPNVLKSNERGNIVFKGVSYPGSSIVDLFADMLRPKSRKTASDPDGLLIFYKALAELNVPETYIVNQKRLANLREFRNSTPASSDVVDTPGSFKSVSGSSKRKLKKQLDSVRKQLQWENSPR